MPGFLGLILTLLHTFVTHDLTPKSCCGMKKLEGCHTHPSRFWIVFELELRKCHRTCASLLGSASLIIPPESIPSATVFILGRERRRGKRTLPT